jgi:hypothetical protein
MLSANRKHTETFTYTCRYDFPGNMDEAKALFLKWLEKYNENPDGKHSAPILAHVCYITECWRDVASSYCGTYLVTMLSHTHHSCVTVFLFLVSGPMGRCTRSIDKRTRMGYSPSSAHACKATLRAHICACMDT